jgi:hypothetical protein
MIQSAPYLSPGRNYPFSVQISSSLLDFSPSALCNCVSSCLASFDNNKRSASCLSHRYFGFSLWAVVSGSKGKVRIRHFFDSCVALSQSIPSVDQLPVRETRLALLRPSRASANSKAWQRARGNLHPAATGNIRIRMCVSMKLKLKWWPSVPVLLGVAPDSNVARGWWHLHLHWQHRESRAPEH